MTDRNAYKGAMALFATVSKLRRKGVDVAVTGVVRNNVDRHRSTYRLLNEALTEARLPLLDTEIPMRAGFQNAVTAGFRSGNSARTTSARRRCATSRTSSSRARLAGRPRDDPAADPEHGWDQEPARRRDGAEQRDEPPARAVPRRQQRGSRPPAEVSRRSEQPSGADAPFYGTGRPLQTSIALDDDCASRLDELARAAGVSANALAVAAPHADGLPAASDAARSAIVVERVNRAGIRSASIERNLRLPEHLRARVR